MWIKVLLKNNFLSTLVYFRLVVWQFYLSYADIVCWNNLLYLFPFQVVNSQVLCNKIWNVNPFKISLGEKTYQVFFCNFSINEKELFIVTCLLLLVFSDFEYLSNLMDKHLHYSHGIVVKVRKTNKTMCYNKQTRYFLIYML